MNPRKEVTLSILAYSICSGSLVLINKLILHHINFPSLVVTFQFVATVVFIYTAKTLKKLPVDDLQVRFIIPYLYYIIAFSLGVFCNMQSLSQSNVETVIVFRALSPCLVAILDALFLGREWPSRRSWVAITGIAVGAYGYALHDPKFQEQGLTGAYFWPMCYLLLISFEMAYGKRLIASVDLKTKSGPVLYTNLLGIFPMLGLSFIAGEPSRWMQQSDHGLSFTSVLLLAVGCATGTGIGYASWWCRDQVSATSFTLIGVLNKVLTVTVNACIWDQHANPSGILCLIVSLVFGALYRQAPLRSATQMAASSFAKANADVWDMDEEDDHEVKSGRTLGSRSSFDEEDPLVKRGMKVR